MLSTGTFTSTVATNEALEIAVHQVDLISKSGQTTNDLKNIIDNTNSDNNRNTSEKGEELTKFKTSGTGRFRIDDGKMNVHSQNFPFIKTLCGASTLSSRNNTFTSVDLTTSLNENGYLNETKIPSKGQEHRDERRLN
eukprot:Awhi_evm2s9915